MTYACWAAMLLVCIPGLTRWKRQRQVPETHA
jgi:hypothetical protein